MKNIIENPYQSESPEICIMNLPWLYRVLQIDHQQLSGRQFQYRATLFHDKATLTVSWVQHQVDVRLETGCLVSPRWISKTICEQGQIIINRLLPVTSPSLVNVFETVPHEWVADRSLINDAKMLVDLLPDYFKRLLSGIYINHKRFYRFLVGPSSLNGHHNHQHGNLRHSIEVTQNALMNGQDRPTVSNAVLIMAALLHDAGKADEYTFNHQHNRFEISTRGALLGHKISIVEWVAAAVAQFQIQIPQQEYLSLMHALTAVKGAPDWAGIREAVSPEAHLLSIADRLSGHEDLFAQTRPANQGFGQYHKHLKGRPYLVACRQ